MSFSLQIRSAAQRKAEAAKTHQARLSAAVSQHIEAEAQGLGYGSAATLASYLGSTVEPWAAQAQAFVSWRDAVWTKVFALFAKSDAIETESPEALIAALPGWSGGANR